MIEKCLVKRVSNKVVCDNQRDVKKVEKVRYNEYSKNNSKYKHLEGIGMDLTKYHPNIIHTLVDGGKKQIPEAQKHQFIAFAKDAYEKGFNPTLFGRNTALHKFIKIVHNIPTNKPRRKTYIKGRGQGQVIKPIVKEIKPKEESESSTESETDIDDVLSEVEEDLRNGKINEVKLKLKKYKKKIPTNFYNQIMNSIK